jgi:insulysin
MIAFFERFIHPSSPDRSKLAVHLHAQASAPTENGDVALEKVEGNGTTPYVINDVRQFRSMLQISAGPQPVKHISEFEELDSKL